MVQAGPPRKMIWTHWEQDSDPPPKKSLGPGREWAGRGLPQGQQGMDQGETVMPVILFSGRAQGRMEGVQPASGIAATPVEERDQQEG